MVVGIYSSSFLTDKLDNIPGVIAPILDDLIPIEGIPKMNTWKKNSSLVFEKLSEGCTQILGQEIVGLRKDKGRFEIECKDIDSEEKKLIGQFDRIVFACSSVACAKILEKKNLNSGSSGINVIKRIFYFFLELVGLNRSFFLKRIKYCDEDSTCFLEGRIHSDASVVP